jgi:KaiC/GvpD/RAD55 family RecA-like ATPase
MDLPGFEQAINKDIVNPPLILLKGPAGTGKTLYCRQFLLEGLALGGVEVFVSSDMGERQFRNLFSNLPTAKMDQIKFLSISKLISGSKENWRSVFNEDDTTNADRQDNTDTQRPLLLLLERIQELLTDLAIPRGTKDIRLVFDSISHLLQFYDERIVQKFVAALSSMLRDNGVASILVMSIIPEAKDVHGGLINSLTSLLDGLVEMKVEEGGDSTTRSIRLISMRGHSSNNPRWIQYKIEDNGELVFENYKELVIVNCVLCGKAIRGKPIIYMENSFDSNTCLDTYRKLTSIYGSGIAPTFGIPADAVNLHFFFIDIVGLSDPSLSVKRQMEKIAVLNNLVRSCQAFKGVGKDKRIVLPTGDGMAIGYLLNAELPLQLSIQLHKLLKSHNESRKAEERLGVRIGISSGNVFVHNDINENQNVWGPGIILARRVMDFGDDLHILVEGNMAKGLMDLKDEYRIYLNELCDCTIKHGQIIKIFSAYSTDFGNREMPTKLRQAENGQI